MSASFCRLCGAEINQPDWTLEDMPKSAQNFTGIDSLHGDSGLNLNIVQCRDCGLVQLLNDPVDYFREVIRATGFSKEMALYRRSQFSDFVESHALDGKAGIEIGCGKGEYLSLLADSGLCMTGLEYSPDSVRACLGLGLNAQIGFLDDLVQSPTLETYSACFMFNFLEHLPQPVDTLRAVAALLNQGGVGLIEVPNFEMIEQEQMFTEFCSDHLSYFTEDTFRQILSRSGFEVLEITSLWNDYILSAQVRKRAQFLVERFENARQRLSESMIEYLDQFSKKSVVAWGAGHQALAVMAACDLSDKIAYVVDSATFKQNKLTPATKIPIFSPEQLFIDPPEAILVMAGSYSDEIVSEIRQKHHNRFSLAVLRGQEVDLNP